MCKKELTSSYF